MIRAVRFERGAALVCAALATASAVAEEWAVVGARQMGMGGAGVALTRGSMSTYWNPAALAAPDGAAGVFGPWDATLSASASAGAVGGVIDTVDSTAGIVDDLGDFADLEARLSDPGQLLNATETQQILKLLTEEIPDLNEPGSGLIVNGSVSLAARYGYFGVSVMGFAYGGGATVVDFGGLALGDDGLAGVIGAGADRTGALSPEGQAFADALVGKGLAAQNQAEELVFQAEQGGVNVGDPGVQARFEDVLQATQANVGGTPDEFFTQNDSGVHLRGILLEEYGLSFAYPFFDIVSVGVTGKLMYGQTYFEPFRLGELEDVENLVDNLYDSSNDMDESLTYGIDVGVLLQPVNGFSLGVVARNVNRPRFDFDGAGDYVLEPQIRAGVGVAVPGTGLSLAVDVDLFENESEALPGYDSQLIAAGLEWAIFETLLLRGGVSKNFVETNEGVVVHAGLGLSVLGMAIEFAGSMSTKFTDVSGNDVPERAGASLFFGINLPL